MFSRESVCLDTARPYARKNSGLTPSDTTHPRNAPATLFAPTLTQEQGVYPPSLRETFKFYLKCRRADIFQISHYNSVLPAYGLRPKVPGFFVSPFTVSLTRTPQGYPQQPARPIFRMYAKRHGSQGTGYGICYSMERSILGPSRTGRAANFIRKVFTLLP